MPCLIALFISCALVCCSAAPLVPRSEPVIIGKVPFYPQEEFECGPASLAGVLNFWSMGVASPQQIAKDIFSGSARGTLTMDMELYAQKLGFDALRYSGNWQDLSAKIKAGYPLVVLVDYGFSVFQVNHFMMLVGFSDEGVVANSGLTERQFIDKNTFLRSWKKTDYWTLWIKKTEGVGQKAKGVRQGL